eukprot:2969204-Pyramimonas_sp.AAC.1
MAAAVSHGWRLDATLKYSSSKGTDSLPSADGAPAGGEGATHSIFRLSGHHGHGWATIARKESFPNSAQILPTFAGGRGARHRQVPGVRSGRAPTRHAKEQSKSIHLGELVARVQQNTTHSHFSSGRLETLSILRGKASFSASVQQRGERPTRTLGRGDLEEPTTRDNILAQLAPPASRKGDKDMRAPGQGRLQTGWPTLLTLAG